MQAGVDKRGFDHVVTDSRFAVPETGGSAFGSTVASLRLIRLRYPVFCVLLLATMGNRFWVHDRLWCTVRDGALWVCCVLLAAMRERIVRVAMLGEPVEARWVRLSMLVGVPAALLLVVVRDPAVDIPGLGARGLRFGVLLVAVVALVRALRSAYVRFLSSRGGAAERAGVPPCSDRPAATLLAGIAFVSDVFRSHWLLPAVLLGVLGALCLALLQKLEASRARGADSILSAGRGLELARDWFSDAHPTRGDDWAAREILRVLAPSAGMRIADIGAGGGFFATRLARIVGPTGRVYATDSNPDAVICLRSARDREGLGQLLPMLAPADVLLPVSEQLDRVLLSNVYLFSDREEVRARAIFAEVRAKTSRGARIVIFDEFVHDAGWLASGRHPPLPYSTPSAEALVRWAAGCLDLVESVPLPPPSRPFAPHERAGYLLVFAPAAVRR